MEARTQTTVSAEEVAELTWYHTIELPGGVVTPGHYDTPATIDRFPFPADLTGKRCLDVGTSDGYWAFEMEKRGAAEVVALDIDDPSRYDWPDPRPAELVRPANQEIGVNRCFALAHRALGSSVERVDLPVYDASPEELGSFDFVHMGALMLHLRDPVKALAAVRSVVSGEFLSYDVISLWASIAHPADPAAVLDGEGKPRWWTPNKAGHRRMLEAAGFEVLESGGPFLTPFGDGLRPARGLSDLRPDRLRELGRRGAFFGFVMRRLGAPCAWARCRPHPDA